MLGLRLHRCRRAEQLVFSVTGERANRVKRQPARGHRAGLVEGHDANRGQPLQMDAALHENTLPGGTRERRHDRHRRRNHERTRTRDDQQHERAIQPDVERLAGHHERHRRDECGQYDNGRRVPGGESIDERLQRRALGLRGLHEVDDPRERGVAPAARDSNGERAMTVDRAGEHFVAFGFLDRQRFSGDRRLVHLRVPVANNAVERKLLTGADNHQCTGGHALDADQPFTGAIAHEHVAGREIDQPANGLAGAVEALCLEPLRGGEQRHHHRGFFVFADRHRANHGDDHQHVDVEREPLDRLPGALRREDRAHDGGGHQQALDPPGSVDHHADATAGDREDRGHGGKPATDARAGRRRRVGFTTVTAAHCRFGGARRMCSGGTHCALARRGLAATVRRSSATCCKVCLKIAMMCWSSSE